MTIPITVHSVGLKTVIISAIFTALAFVIVSLRLYTRLRVVRTPGAEDAIILAALVSYMLYCLLKAVADSADTDSFR